MQPSPEQISEMITAMQGQCQYFKAATEYNPRDDTSFSNWGSMLMHLSMVSEDQTVKKEYLKQSIDKLEKAIALNDNSKTLEGELAYFNLGNALYFAFFLEKDDKLAQIHLDNAKRKFGTAMSKEPGNPIHTQMMEQLETAHEQRKSAHEQLARLEGKTEDEKRVEILHMQKQMLESVVESHRAAAQKSPNDPVVLLEQAKSMFELAMLCGRSEGSKLFSEAKDIVDKALKLSPSDTTATWLHAVLVQAMSNGEVDSSKAAELFAQSQKEYDAVLKREIDLNRREALRKERQVLTDAMKSWVMTCDQKEQGAKVGGKSAGKGAKGKEDVHDKDMAGFVVLAGLALLACGVAYYLSKKKN